MLCVNYLSLIFWYFCLYVYTFLCIFFIVWLFVNGENKEWRKNAKGSNFSFLPPLNMNSVQTVKSSLKTEKGKCSMVIHYKM